MSIRDPHTIHSSSRVTIHCTQQSECMFSLETTDNARHTGYIRIAGGGTHFFSDVPFSAKREYKKSQQWMKSMYYRRGSFKPRTEFNNQNTSGDHRKKPYVALVSGMNRNNAFCEDHPLVRRHMWYGCGECIKYQRTLYKMEDSLHAA